jgi:hypothetical protein
MHDTWYANSHNAARFWNDIINCYGYTILYIYRLEASTPPTKIAKPLYNASSGAIGKLMGKLNVTMKNVDDGPANDGTHHNLIV